MNSHEKMEASASGSCPYTALWRAVITFALADVVTQSNRPEELVEKRVAAAWARRGGEDFRTVCDLAGLEWSLVQKEFLKRMGRNGR